MSKNDNQNRNRNQNPFAVLAECVGMALVSVAMVPALIVDAVVSSATS
jgi:hypothetical protein